MDLTGGFFSTYTPTDPAEVARQAEIDRRTLQLGPKACPEDGEVVGIGVICDIMPPDPERPFQYHVSFYEFVDLASGKRVIIQNDRGVSMGGVWANPDGTSGRYRPLVTEDTVRQDADGALQPDEGDVEDAGEKRPWHWLSELAARQGISVTPERLKSLDYQYEHTNELQARIRDDRGGATKSHHYH
ncbi:MAG: hypothetical protein LBM23_06810 [Propionibacteriaceae bacterium]|jgi:hypothetical protein|nr:hypothetical protein [Propionibacteriaceae bacterium]